MVFLSLVFVTSNEYKNKVLDENKKKKHETKKRDLDSPSGYKKSKENLILQVKIFVAVF